MARASSEPTALSTKTAAGTNSCNVFQNEPNQFGELVDFGWLLSVEISRQISHPPLFPKRGCNSLKTMGRSRKKSAKRLQATEIVWLSHALRENEFRLQEFCLI